LALVFNPAAGHGQAGARAEGQRRRAIAKPEREGDAAVRHAEPGIELTQLGNRRQVRRTDRDLQRSPRDELLGRERDRTLTDSYQHAASAPKQEPKIGPGQEGASARAQVEWPPA
jgi:hypothetical protein